MVLGGGIGDCCCVAWGCDTGGWGAGSHGKCATPRDDSFDCQPYTSVSTTYRHRQSPSYPSRKFLDMLTKTLSHQIKRQEGRAKSGGKKRPKKAKRRQQGALKTARPPAFASPTSGRARERGRLFCAHEESRTRVGGSQTKETRNTDLS